MLSDPVVLKKIFDQLSDGVLVVDHLSRKVSYFNEPFLRLWGISQETADRGVDSELIGLVLQQLTDPEQFIGLVEELYQNPSRSSVDRLELKNSVFVHRRSESLELEGKILGRIWFFRDITKEVVDTENIQTQKNVLQTIIASIPYSVFWKNLNLDYLGCNDLFASNAGLAPQDIVGKNDYDMPWSRAESDSFRAYDREIIASGVGVTNLEETQLRSDGVETTLLTSKVPLRDALGNVSGIIGIYTDITEFRKAQRLIKDQEAQLVSSSQMSSLGEMAAGIAHEINNPLSIINASTIYLRKILAKPQVNLPSVVEVLDEIEETVKRIARIVVGLRNITRKVDQEKTECTLRPIFEDVLSVARERFKVNRVLLTVPMESPSMDVVFLADRIQISQVLINLFNNAFDAVLSLPGAERWIRVELGHDSQHLTLTLTDSGPGIPPEVQLKMFNPFYTTKPIGKGTGLGLSISKTIIENQGGSFSYDSTSANTSFRIRLLL